VHEPFDFYDPLFLKLIGFPFLMNEMLRIILHDAIFESKNNEGTCEIVKKESREMKF